MEIVILKPNHSAAFVDLLKKGEAETEENQAQISESSQKQRFFNPPKTFMLPQPIKSESKYHAVEQEG